MLAEYHAAMGALIVAHNGTLERFSGDGLMVFFNDPVPVPEPAMAAVRMALAMQERFSVLAQAWKRRGYGLEMGIGVAQGYATIGAIGFEGRRGLRRDRHGDQSLGTPVRRGTRWADPDLAACLRPGLPNNCPAGRSVSCTSKALRGGAAFSVLRSGPGTGPG